LIRDSFVALLFVLGGKPCEKKADGGGVLMTFCSFAPPAAKYAAACVPRTMLRMLIALSSLLILVAGCRFLGEAPPPLAGRLIVTGSSTLAPLIRVAASLFEQRYPQVHVEVHATNSIDGLNALTRKQADIGLSDLYADLASYPDPRLTDHIVAGVPFTLIASSDVVVASLTRAQLRAVFSTEMIENWKQIGGKSLPLRLVVPPPASEIRTLFREYVLDGLQERSMKSRGVIQQASPFAVRDAVVQTPGALGYLALPDLTAHVKMLAIDGKFATAANIAAGTYPFWAYEHCYTLGEDNPLASAFLDFLFSPTIQHLAAHLHYLALADLHHSETSRAASPR
jgi:phosphate transport system substrate-binding protein